MCVCVCVRYICAPEAKSSDEIDAGDDDAPDTAWARGDATWLIGKSQILLPPGPKKIPRRLLCVDDAPYN